MSTGFGHLALSFAKDCDRAQARCVQIANVLCISALMIVCWWLAVTTLIGAVIGLVIVAWARDGAREVRRDICVSSFRTFLERSEGSALQTSNSSKFAQLVSLSELRTLAACETSYYISGITHLCLSERLLRIPVLSRAYATHGQ